MALTFFDVETPNRRNDRICSIGVIRVDDLNRVEYRKHAYIDPEAPFDRINTEIHGIGAFDVMGCPNFVNLWDRELRSVFSDTTVVAHNAQFDLTVLDKTLDSYGREIHPVEFLCTKKAAERCEIDFQDHRLPTVCSAFGISMRQHHDAMCDTEACMEVFNAMRSRKLLDPICTSLYHHVPRTVISDQRTDSNTASAMTDLYGITLGVSIDNHILPQENQAFRDWVERFAPYRTHPFFTEVFDLLARILADDLVTQEERDVLLNYTRPFVTDGHNKRSTVAMQELLGIIRGIGADKRVNEAEAASLVAWMEANRELHGDRLFLRVLDTVSDAIDDGVVTPEEEREILDSFDAMLNPAQETGGQLGLAGKKVCLTGDFAAGSKKEVATMIEERGGEVIKGVTKKCDLVVIGGRGSEQYAFGNYGSKVKKAMEYQDSGVPIAIVQEADLEL